MLSGIGKDAGATAAETLKDTVGQATAALNQDIPAGPAIVLTAGALWLLSLVIGPRASLWRQAIPQA